jgi:hypothetical protein
VTQLLPKTVSDDEFAKIFATRSRQSRVSEVLSTLSQTVHDLEEPLSRMSIANQETQQQQHQQQQHSSQEPADDGTARLSLRHADGSETNLHFQFNPLAGQYLPYTPPPPPEPIVDEAATSTTAAEGAAETAVTEPAANGAEELAAQTEPQTRVYKAVVTIEETVDADGQVKVVAHSPELIEDDGSERGPRTFLERMWWRQVRYDESCLRRNRQMQAISVRRIRKLKMKKKKYKKLMRKTRNLRRKLDRL